MEKPKHPAPAPPGDTDSTVLSDSARLASIPSMVDSILTAQAEPLEECAPYDPNENWS